MEPVTVEQDPLLDAHQERALRWVTTRHKLAIWLGFATMTLGGFYGIWAVGQLDRKHAPDPAAAFDRPIARIAETLGSREDLRRVKPQSALEEELLKQLTASEELVGRLFLTLLRVLISTLILGIGLAMLAWGLTARTFSRIVTKLIAGARFAPTGTTKDRLESGVPR